MSRQSRPWQVFSKHSKLCVQSTTRPLYRYKVRLWNEAVDFCFSHSGNCPFQISDIFVGMCKKLLMFCSTCIVSSRLCRQLEDSILEISTTYPLFTFSVWRLLAHLAPGTTRWQQCALYHRFLLSQWHCIYEQLYSTTVSWNNILPYLRTSVFSETLNWVFIIEIGDRELTWLFRLRGAVFLVGLVHEAHYFCSFLWTGHLQLSWTRLQLLLRAQKPLQLFIATIITIIVVNFWIFCGFWVTGKVFLQNIGCGAGLQEDKQSASFCTPSYYT